VLKQNHNINLLANKNTYIYPIYVEENNENFISFLIVYLFKILFYKI